MSRRAPERLSLAAVLLSMLAASVSAGPAQRAVGSSPLMEEQSGQFILPSGVPPRSVVSFTLSTPDGALMEFLFSDASGRFRLPRLEARREYRITAPGVAGVYETTIFDFGVPADREMRVVLRAYRTNGATTDIGVSAGSFYRPNERAAKLHQQAIEAIQKNNFSSAEGRLRDAISADEKYAAPLNDLAVIAMRRKNFAEAEALLLRSLQADSKNISALLNLGIARIYLHKFDLAVAPLRETLRLDSRISSAHLNLGVALVELDQFDEAERELLRSLEGPPGAESIQAIRANLYLGKLYARTGEFEKSLEHFDRFLRLAPWAGNADEVKRVVELIKSEMAKKGK